MKAHYFHGRIDDVRIYERALSAEEIMLLAHPEEWAKAGPAASPGDKALDALLTGFDSLMAKGDHAGARRAAEAEVTKPANAPQADTLRAAARIARALEERPSAIRRGARSMVGRDVRLKLRTGAASGKLREVTEAHLVLATTYTINRQKRERSTQVAWSGLHPEQVNEFAEAGGWKITPVDSAIAAAYTAFAAKDFELAGNALASIAERGNPLARHLARRTERANTQAAYDDAMKRARSLARRRSWKAAAQACEVALRLRPDAPEATKLLAEAERRTAPPPTLTIDLGQGVKMEMVYIKPGVFTMGNKSGPAAQKPEHSVALTRGYYIGKYEVTQAQYKAVTGADPSRVKGPDRPVETVSWFDAVEFCRQATERTRLAFRLPTEAEWEYACRAGSTGTWCFGNDEAKLSEYAWLGLGFGAPPRPVGERKPNAWGLYDMHGNVREWCADWYDPGYYAKSPGKDPTGPAEGGARIQRGGCAGRGVPETWSSGRGGDSPQVRYPHIGFRAVVPVRARKGAASGGAARAAYDKAIARAQMRIRFRNWKGAAEACEEALKAKPGDPEAKKLLAEAQSHLGPAPTLTLDLGGGIRMEMVYIKPGRFRMGFAGGKTHEKPVHEVEITRGFYIGRYEVTKAQAAAVLGGDRGQGTTPREPAPHISWLDAMEFCRKASARTRMQVRLPTEAEWEYAARAGSTSKWSFGDDPRLLNDCAWHQGNAGGVAHTVGGKKPNA
ncbi:MAG: formylglycine-generating enzyme family protein, partial [Planctomycetota bacterium]